MRFFSKKDRLYNIFSSIPQLECDRLILRRMKKSDAADMYEYARDEEVTKYLLWHPHDSLEYTQQYLNYIQTKYREGTFYDWALVLKSESKMIGTCGFTAIDTDNGCAEIGYVINPAYRGHGFACEAVSRVLDFGFNDLEMHRIEAKYIVGNEASRRVMEKCNMKFEGIARDLMLIKGEYRDIGCCAILKSDYEMSLLPD
ncbi:MAG: GNAT family N-acetyltransferase [Clostridia bacterium]|nr:GNAT family N-acetyltransferase [Clostridia bacterium]